jgi:acetyltransferase-like isoleucine patch superfamily enzyme
MPGWFVDLGRHLGGIVVFSLCALFSAVALVPCYYAYVWIVYLAETHTQIPPSLAGLLSVPFLYGVWGWGFLVLTIIYKRVIFYRPKEGGWPLFSWPVIGWGTTGALQNWANATFLMHWRGTTMLNMYMKAMGVKMGHRVTINSVDIYDWDLITIEDDVIIGGGAVILGHLVENGQMKMRPVRIGKKALVGTGARVMPGCTIEELGVLGAGSIMKKGSTVTTNAIFGGMPAKFIRERGALDVQNDGVAPKDA